MTKRTKKVKNLPEGQPELVSGAIPSSWHLILTMTNRGIGE